MSRRTRGRKGTGMIYKQPGCARYTIKYYRDGKAIREATGKTDYVEARKKLTARLSEVADGSFAGTGAEHTRVQELAEGFLRDYRINGKKSIGHAQARWGKHLAPFFSTLRAANVTSDVINRYVDHRMQEGAEKATINRELAALKRMFRLGYYTTPPQVLRLPAFPRLQENAARSGFVEDQQYQKLAAAASEVWLRAFLEIAHTYGWRKRELLNLRVRHVDIAQRTIRLDPGSTKNGTGREVVMTATIAALITACVDGKQPDDHVFTRADGKPVRDFRGSWKNLCDTAGVSGLLVHDLRRTAARNLRRANVAEGVIMKIGGWKTASVFRRYDIMNQSDVRDAMEKLEQAQKDSRASFGHDLGITAPAAGSESKPRTVN
jgi:integrase